MASLVISVVIAMAFARGARWKVSLHLRGIAGSVTVLVLLFGPVLLVLTPLVALVVWARGRVGVRRLVQAVVASLPTVGMLWLLRVRVTFPR